MTNTIKEKVMSYIKETEMLTECTRVIAGVSGGADSVFLFYVLKEWCDIHHIPFEVVHVHHSIRDLEADRDADFVMKLCTQEEIPCRIVKRNIPLEAEQNHETMEEAGRHARYQIFHEEAEKVPGTKIALAHHKNDVAETMLFHLARGTGLKGLGSIRPIRGEYIRPLLTLEKEEIQSALRKEGILWCEDSTNTEDDATRNKIRHHVLTYLTEEINARSISHLAEAANIAGEAADFIAYEAEKRYALYCDRQEEGVFISKKLVENEPKLMQEEVIRKAVEESCRTLKDISSLHIRLIMELFFRETGKFLNLPKGLTAEKKKNGIYLIRLTKPKKNTHKHGRVIQ